MKVRLASLVFALALPVTSVAATFTVTSTADSGVGTLRQAIIDANANPGADSINFAIAAAGVQTITPLTALPNITSPVVIDGSSQTGFAGTPLIELTGTSAGVSVNGLTLASGSNGSTVRALIVNGFDIAGIRTDNSGSHTIVGNWLGLDDDGATALPNRSGLVLFASTQNTIGGSTPADRNVIGGNSNIQFNTNGADQNSIRGNYIGTDVTGMLDRSNNAGLFLFFSANNVVGGTLAGEGNLISGNNNGLNIQGSSATGNSINGNIFGLASDLATPLPNSTNNISVFSNDNVFSLNTIAYSSSAINNGIVVGSNATGIRISQNSIYSNGGLGIDLNNDGLSANDTLDPDGASNLTQNYPLITSASETGGNVNIIGTLNSTASSLFLIEFFVNSACDASGFGEGETYIGNTVINTDGSGNGAFNVTFAGPAGFVTATATVANNTSEFSNCVAITSTNPGDISFSSPTYSAAEDAGSVTITVTRSGGSFGPASVTYTTSDGTAFAGTDYVTNTATLTWNDGEVGDKSFNVIFINDPSAEPSETFDITLSNVSGATLGSPSVATATITDNDPPAPGSVQLSAASYSVSEADGTVTITVTRTGGSNGTASVNYAVAVGTAGTADFDSTVSGTLNWGDLDGASKTFSVPITQDAFPEGNEVFTVTLSTVSGATLGSPATATVTIVDDEAAVVVPAFSSMTLLLLAVGVALAASTRLRL